MPLAGGAGHRFSPLVQRVPTMAPSRRTPRATSAPTGRARQQARALGGAGAGLDRPWPRRPHRRCRAARSRSGGHRGGARTRDRQRCGALLGWGQSLRRLRRPARVAPRAGQPRRRRSRPRRRLSRPERERLPRSAEGLDGTLQGRRYVLLVQLSRLATSPGAYPRAECARNLAFGRSTAMLNNYRELSHYLSYLNLPLGRSTSTTSMSRCRPVTRAEGPGEDGLLAGQLLGQRIVDPAAPFRVGHAKQARGAVALVLPARVLEDRVDADPLDRHAGRERGADLLGDVVEPGRPAAALAPGLGHQDRPAEARVGVGQELRERLVVVVAERDGRAAQVPLVVAVVVDAQDVEVLGPAAQLRLLAAGQHVPGLELRLVVAAAHDVDQRVDLDEAGARVDAADRLDRGDRGADELPLQLAAAAAAQGVEPPPVAGPGPVGDLVDGRVERHRVGLLTDDARRRGREGGEAVDEGGG